MRILIFDDDRLLGNDYKENILKVANCSVELSTECPTLYSGDLCSVDLIFLDYKRPNQKSFIEVMNLFRDKGMVSRTVVYSSWFDQDVFELLKPFNIFSFIPRESSSLFLEQLIFYFQKNQQMPHGNINTSINTRYIVVKKNNFYIKVNLKDIEHVEVDEKYLIYYIGENKYMVRDSLTNFMLKHGDLFIRVHGRHAINKSGFLKLDYKEQVIYLENNITLPLSKHYRAGLYEYFSIMS